MKKGAPGCLGNLGMGYYLVMWGLCSKKHEIRIPIKQPVFFRGSGAMLSRRFE